MAAIATAPNSCELQDTLGRHWAIQIKPTGAGPEEYVFLRGVQSLSVNIETSSVDSSDIDSDGWASETKTGRSLTIQADGKFVTLNNLPILEDSQRLLQATGQELGADGTIDVRAWRTDIDEGWECNANNAFTEGGGDANGLRTFSAALKSNCAPTRIHSVEEGAEDKASVPVDPEEIKKLIRPKGTADDPVEDGA